MTSSPLKALRFSGRLSTTWRTAPCVSVITRGIGGSVAWVAASGHVAAHSDRPRPPRAARLARGRRRPRQADRQGRPQPQGARQGQRGPVRHLARPPGPSAPDRRPDGQLDQRRAARLARRRGRRDRRRPARRRRPRRARCRRSRPATPTGPTPSSPRTPCAGSGSSTPPATRPPPGCSPPRSPPAPAGARGRGKLLALAGLGTVGVGGYLGGHLTYAEGVGVNMATFEEYPQDWTQVLADAALGEGEMRAVDVDGVAIVVARSGGEVHALSDTCVHRGGSLADGELVGECVRCPLHDSRVPARGRLGRAGPGRLPAAGARGARPRRLDRGPGAAAPVAGRIRSRALHRTSERESHGRDQDGRRARRRADGARHRPGRRAGGLRRRAARGRRRAPRQGRRQDREAARPRGREGQARAGRRRRRARPHHRRRPTTASWPTAIS